MRDVHLQSLGNTVERMEQLKGMQDSVERESYVPEPADQIAEMLRSKLSEA